MRIPQAFVAIILATGVESMPQGLPGGDWNLPAGPIDMASEGARNLLTSDSVHQIARTDYLPQTRCSDGEAAALLSWAKIRGKRSQKPSGDMCLLDEAPIICPRGGGLTLRKKTPSCCAGPETVDRYPYGAGLISSRKRCEYLSRALNSASCKERKGNVYCCDYVVSIVPPSKWKLRIQGEADIVPEPTGFGCVTHEF